MIKGDDFRLRIGVGSLGGLHSSVFRFWGNRGKSDVYVGIRNFANEVKISLHESGVCNAGLTAQFAQQEKSALAELGGSRHQSQWIRPKTVGPEFVIPLQLAIPYSELRDFNTNKNFDSKEVIWLKAPKKGHSIIISCAFSGQSRSNELWPGKKNGTMLLGVQDLPNGEKFWLFFQEFLTDQIEINIISEAEAHMKNQRMVRFSKSNEEPNRILVFKEFFNHQMLLILDKALD